MPNSIPKTKHLAIVGIHTEIGKTIASAVLVEALLADYWKPIQTGTIDQTDTTTVRNLVTNNKSVFYQEAYTFLEPVSPHKAAIMNNQEIQLENIIPPLSTNKFMVIETAGGIYTPINLTYTMADMVRNLADGIVIVAAEYLGSINHTLLTIEAVQKIGIPIIAIVLCGIEDSYTIQYIENQRVAPILVLPTMACVNKENIAIIANTWKNNPYFKEII